MNRRDIISMALEVGLLDSRDDTERDDGIAQFIGTLSDFAALAVKKESQARIQCQTDFMHYQNEMQARGVREIKAAYARGLNDGKLAASGKEK